MAIIGRIFSSLAELTLRHPIKVGVATILLSLGVSAAIGYSWGSDQFSRAGVFSTLVGLLTFGGTLEKMVSRPQAPSFVAASGKAPFPYNPENVSRVFSVETVLVVYGMIQTTYGDMIWDSITC